MHSEDEKWAILYPSKKLLMFDDMVRRITRITLYTVLDKRFTGHVVERNFIHSETRPASQFNLVEYFKIHVVCLVFSTFAVIWFTHTVYTQENRNIYVWPKTFVQDCTFTLMHFLLEPVRLQLFSRTVSHQPYGDSSQHFYSRAAWIEYMRLSWQSDAVLAIPQCSLLSVCINEQQSAWRRVLVVVRLDKNGPT